jgi:MFS transporter, FHS family, glucose/mannose:H+ symporter
MRTVFAANAGLLIAGLVSFILMGAGQSLFGPALPAFARLFGIGAGQAGLLVSAQWVGAALGVALMFWRGDSITPRIALAVMAAGAAGIALSFGWWPTVAATVVFGLGYGCSTVIYNRRFLILFGARGPSMLALLNAVFGIGAIGAPLIFVAIGSNPALAYAGLAALAAATFVIAGQGAPVVTTQAQGPGFRMRWPVLAFGALGIGTEACLIGLGPTGLIARGVSETGAAEMLSAFFVAFLLARLVLVPLAGAIPPFPLLSASMAAAAACAAAIAMGGPVWLFVPMGGFAGLFFPAFYMTGVAQMGHDPRVSPVLISAGLVGGISSPLIMGAIMAQVGPGAFFALVAMLVGGAAMLALLMMRGMTRPQVA